METKLSAKTILNAGCGRTAEKEKKQTPTENQMIYLDIRDNVGADVVWNLNKIPLPFEDNHFDEIVLHHIIEHISNIYELFEDIHRILKPNGVVKIVVPHYTDWTFWRDPSHKTHFNSYSFDRFEDTKSHHFDTKYPFKVEKLKISFQNIWKYTGVEFLVNLSVKYRAIRGIRKFWESYLSFIMRASTIKVRMKALK